MNVIVEIESENLPLIGWFEINGERHGLVIPDGVADPHAMTRDFAMGLEAERGGQVE